MKKKGSIAFLGFWVLFFIYFIFVHPCIIYYNTPHTGINTEDGRLALFFLFSSLTLWTIIFGFTLWLIIKNSIIAKRNLSHINQNGKSIKGIIRANSVLKENKSGIVAQEIIIELNNFSGENIHHKMIVNDSRPQEDRFNIGKSVYLKVDPDFKRHPYYFIEGSKTKSNYTLLLVWTVFLAAVAFYYYYAYTSESGGYGWRFLELFHPLLVIPACFIFFVGLIYLIFRFFIMRNKTGRQQLQLKFWGVKSMATINEVQQTGTYINEQPQVKYTLAFTDKNGKSHQFTKKEIVSLMDIGSISSVKTRAIIYLPEKPDIFDFFDQINN